MDGSGQSLTTMDEKKAAAQRVPIRVLLLDDRIDNLILRSAILRKHGYEAIKAATIEEAEAHLHEADITFDSVKDSIMLAPANSELKSPAHSATNARRFRSSFSPRPWSASLAA